MAPTPQAPNEDWNTSQTWIVGAAEDCDVVVTQPTVSRHHCELTRTGRDYWITDLDSRNGTYVDGRQLAPRVPTLVRFGAPVTLGSQVPLTWPGMGQAGRGFTEDIGVPRPLEGRVITIGRSPDSDKQYDLPTVSWEHARIVVEGGQYVIEDLNSRNGTALDQVHNKIQRAVLSPASDVYLGSYKIAARELLSARKVEMGESVAKEIAFRGDTMLLGRDPKSDIPLDFPMISWQHARLTRVEGGILVEDLGSRNGTFVDGVRVSGKVLARPGVKIGLGSFVFQMLDSGKLAQREYHGNLTIEAEGVVVNAPSGNRLIEAVSLTVYPSELVALMGPAGAGKTTLLKALNGYTKPAAGRVLFNGVSLYGFYDRFRQQMGYVPQDDIVHPQLTVGEALYFSARLRTDLSDKEIRERTRKVLGQLQMEDKIDTVIGSPERKTLSGGQRKRVNIALELINDTPVLFLDEPTSGLSSYDAESVIDLLKDLSRQGKTIITTIHQPSLKIYKQFDDLIMVNRDKGGRTGSMVYFGPAYPDSIEFFRPKPATGDALAEPSPEMLLSGVAGRTSAEWTGLYAASRYRKEFVEGRSGKVPSTSNDKDTAKPRRHFDLTQWLALVRRNLIVKTRDRTQSAILLAQAPLFAALICLVYHPLVVEKSFKDFSELSPKLAGVHFLMVVAAIWFGCNNAARDIVGEWTVYKRERMVTLKLGSYVMSKAAVLLALCLVQCLSLLTIVYFVLQLKSNFGLDLLVLLVSSLIGAGLGLCISASQRTTESAIALLPVVLLPIIALGGGMRPIYQIDETFRWVTSAVPSRWAYEANLLNETIRDGWKPEGKTVAMTDIPDPTDPVQKCQLDKKQQQEMQRQQQETERQQQEQAARQPRPAGAPPAAPPPAPPPPASCTVLPAKVASDPHVDPNSLLQGDVAEVSIPRYLMTYDNDQGKHRTVRAFDKELQVDAQGNAVHPIWFRHSFRDSMIVLVTMLVALFAGVLAILYWRDSEPQ